MKRTAVALIVVASIGGFASSVDAQAPKKLPIHPEAAKDPSLQQGSVKFGNVTTPHAGGALSGTTARPQTSNAPPGGNSTHSSTKN
jgi:hypothetical protein